MTQYDRSCKDIMIDENKSSPQNNLPNYILYLGVLSLGLIFGGLVGFNFLIFDYSKAALEKLIFITDIGVLIFIFMLYKAGKYR